MGARPMIGHILTAIALASCVAAPAHAQTATASDQSTATASPGIPFIGVSPEVTTTNSNLDAATARAFELEREITALDDDARALDERIAVTNQRLVVQQDEVDRAEERLASAKTRYRSRLVQVYKRGTIDPLTILLSADTLNDLVTRAAVLSRIAEDDSRVVADLNIATADARYQQATLADVQSQDRMLRAELRTRRESLTKLLAEQDALVAKLTVEAREALLQARRITAETRQNWRQSSIPVGTTIPRATAAVDAYPGVGYLVSAYMPRQFKTSAKTFTAVCSWYGPGFNGRGTASGQVFNEDDLTCASRTLPFGTVLALTRGDRRVIVYVNDRGPYVDGRDLDLSRAAATALGFSGVASVQAEIVIPQQ